MNRRADWRTTTIIRVILVICTIVAYRLVPFCNFISLDDADYVVNNPHVRNGLSWSGWHYAWTSWECSNWHPLTWLSLQLDSSLWGTGPAGYHITNLILHAASVLLLFEVLLRLTGCTARCAVVAGLFALHPLHVESVAWVSERKDVLSTLFLLLTLLAYLHFVSKPGLSRYLLVMLTFACGLLAKPMLVTLPIQLLLLDFWPLARIQPKGKSSGETRFPRRRPAALLVEKIPLFSLAFADGIITILAQMGPVKLMVDVAFDTRITNMFNAYAWYLQKTFVPVGLTILYPHPERTLSWTNVVIGIVLMAAISIWTVRQRRSHPHLLFGWGWFVISLLPVIGLIQVGMQAYADRYAYIPHIGLFVAIVWEVHGRLLDSKPGRIAAASLAITALIACGILTSAQTGYWRDNDALWGHALELNPNNGFAHAHIADVRLGANDYERAIFHIEQGLHSKRSGYVANAYFNWGRCLAELHRPSEAEEKYLEALRIDPNHEASLEKMAELRNAQGRTAEAARYTARHAAALRQRLSQMPEHAAVESRLGMLAARQGNILQALKHFERVVQLAPNSAEGYNNLALVQTRLNRRRDAKANFLRALQINPSLGTTHFLLGQLCESENDLTSAKHHYAEALRLNPADAGARQSLDRLSTK